MSAGTTAPAAKAYRYARFSHSQQADGMSLERQADAAHAWAAQRGMTIDDRYAAFVDSGVSASKGKNVLRGSLAKILSAVKAGDIARDSYLVIESVSRFTRLVPRLSSKVLESLVAAGVRVVFLDSGMEYNADTIDQLGNDVVFRVNAAAAADYAKTLKGYKLKSWDKGVREARATGKILTRCLPFWLECPLGKERNVSVHPVYGDVVRRIYAEYTAGRGIMAITDGLNHSGIAPRAGGSARRAKSWHFSLIIRVLANPAVYGTFQPHLEIEAPKSWSLEDLAAALIRKRAPRGEPIDNYFPAVIDRATFQRAQEIRRGNRVGQKGRSGGGEGPKHILARLARCPECGSTMVRLNKGAEHRGSVNYLCTQARSGSKGTCVRHYVRVAAVEAALIAGADLLAAGAPGANAEINAQRAKLETELASERAKLEKLGDTMIDMIERGEEISSPMNAMHTKLETKVNALAAELNTLQAKAAATSTNVVKARVANMVATLKAYADKGPFGAGVEECAAAMFETFSHVVVDYRNGELTCHWRHGVPPSVLACPEIKARG